MPSGGRAPSTFLHNPTTSTLRINLRASIKNLKNLGSMPPDPTSCYVLYTPSISTPNFGLPPSENSKSCIKPCTHTHTFKHTGGGGGGGGNKVVFGVRGNPRASPLYSALVVYYRKKNIKLGRLTGMGFDGAATLSSYTTGVQRRLKELSPHALFVHCHCHVLQLASVQAANATPGIKHAYIILMTLWKFFHYSPKCAVIK